MKRPRRDSKLIFHCRLQLPICDPTRMTGSLEIGNRKLLVTLPAIASEAQPDILPSEPREPMPIFSSCPLHAVEGPIRVARARCGHPPGRLNAQRVMEPESNPFLALFMKASGVRLFRLSSRFVQRFEQLQALTWGASQKVVVATSL